MSTQPSTAMVLAAGLGKRMRPLTDDRPKPLVEVAGKALIDHALDRFADAGLTRAIVNVHYHADMLEAHLADRMEPEILISDERDLLMETGGGLKKAEALLGAEPFYCTNTDAILMDADDEEACAALTRTWDAERMDALLLLAPIEKASGYDGSGDFNLYPDGQIELRSGAAAPYVFTGLQILAPALLEGAPAGPFSTRLLWDKARAAGRLFGLIHNGFWMHVGDPEGLKLAEDRLSGKAETA